MRGSGVRFRTRHRAPWTWERSTPPARACEKQAPLYASRNSQFRTARKPAGRRRSRSAPTRNFASLSLPPRCHDAVSSLQPSRSIHSFTSCEVGSTSEPLSETLRYSRRGRTRPGCFGRLSSKLANGFEPSPAKTSAEPFQPRYSYQAR